MVQRLVISSYYSGMEETKGATGRSSQPLFVAESLHPDKEEGSSQIIGVVELAYDDCPIPFDAQSRDGCDITQRSRSPFVCNLAVLPAYRGMGAGKALLERVLEAAIAGEGSCWGDSSTDARKISEIWLQTHFKNTAALRMYKKHGFVCEGIDPDVRRGRERQVYLRKRITSASPAYGRDLLRIIEDGESDGGKPRWSVSYDLDCRQGEQIIGELNFVEENFGTLAPVVAALGTFVGIILF
jgi:ribosomal protein S18 acetylase RimI-like enzyme